MTRSALIIIYTDKTCCKNSFSPKCIEYIYLEHVSLGSTLRYLRIYKWHILSHYARDNTFKTDIPHCSPKGRGIIYILNTIRPE